MKRTLSFVVTATVSLCLVGPVGADGNPAGQVPTQEQLGRVLFKTSCSPEAQKQFERALATLHSFFFPETIKASLARLTRSADSDRPELRGVRHRLTSR